MVKREKIHEHTVMYMYICIYTMRGDAATGKTELAKGKGVYTYFF